MVINYKSNVITNSLEKKKKAFFLKRRLFLRKLFLRKNRLLFKKDLVLNYFFFKKILNSFKKKKIQYNSNIFLKTKLILKVILPEFSIHKNVFNKKNRFNHLIKKNNLSYVYFNNHLVTNSYGVNNYIILNKYTNKPYLNFKKSFLDEDNFNLLSFKNENKLESKFLYEELNSFFNYNLFNLNILEVYKILIILNINCILN